MRLLACLISFMLALPALAQPIMRDTTGTPLCDNLLARLRACPVERLTQLHAPRAWQMPDAPTEQYLQQIISGQALPPTERQRYRLFHMLPRDPRLDYEQNCAELSDGLPEGC